MLQGFKGLGFRVLEIGVLRDPQQQGQSHGRLGRTDTDAKLNMSRFMLNGSGRRFGAFSQQVDRYVQATR